MYNDNRERRQILPSPGIEPPISQLRDQVLHRQQHISLRYLLIAPLYKAGKGVKPGVCQPLNLYLGWTDEDKVHISDDLIISQVIEDSSVSGAFLPSRIFVNLTTSPA